MIVLYNHAKNWDDPSIGLGEKAKKSAKTTFCRHLIPYNPGLRFFSENHLPQKIDHIVLYNHAKKLGRSLEQLW